MIKIAWKYNYVFGVEEGGLSRSGLRSLATWEKLFTLSHFILTQECEKNQSTGDFFSFFLLFLFFPPFKKHKEMNKGVRTRAEHLWMPLSHLYMYIPTLKCQVIPWKHTQTQIDGSQASQSSFRNKDNPKKVNFPELFISNYFTVWWLPSSASFWMLLSQKTSAKSHPHNIGRQSSLWAR